MAYLIAVVPTLNNIARTAPDNPLAILGKHSLPIFIAGTLLAMVAQVMKLVNPGGLPYDTLLIATGIVMQFALAYYLEWLPSIGWGRKGAVQAKPAVPPAELVKVQVKPEPVMANTTVAFFVMPAAKSNLSAFRCSRTFKYAPLRYSKIALFATA